MKELSSQEATAAFSDDIEDENTNSCTKSWRRLSRWSKSYLWVPVSGYGVEVSLPNTTGRSFYYWEYLVMAQKVVLIFFLIFVQRYQTQGVLVFFLILTFILMQLWNEPYYTKRLQRLHVTGLMVNLLYVVLKLVSAGLSVYSGQIASSTEKAVNEELLILSRAFNYVEHNAD